MSKNLYLLAYKSADCARKSGELLFSVHLKGCEVTPALNLTANKFEVKLEVPSAEGMTEMYLRFISVSITLTVTWQTYSKHHTPFFRPQIWNLDLKMKSRFGLENFSNICMF